MMRQLSVLAAAGVLAWAAACTGGGDGAAGTGGPYDGGPSSNGTSGGGAGGSSGSGSSDGGPGGGTSSAYAGGNVTVSLGDADGGAVDNGAVSGKVTLHMVPANPSAIASIEALVDGTLVGTATKAPYDVVWDSASVPNAPHTVSARPHDLAGATGNPATLAITTNNFLLAGTWKWTNITDSEPGFGADRCSDTTVTVTFDQKTSTMTLPMFYLKCTAQNNAPYSSKINGFSKSVAPAEYGGPITNKTGTVTTTLSMTNLMQTDSFNNDTQSGTLTKMP